MRRAEAAIERLLDPCIGGEWWAAGPRDHSFTVPPGGFVVVALPDWRTMAELGHGASGFRQLISRIEAEHCADEVLALGPRKAEARDVRQAASFAEARGWRFVPGPMNPWALLDVARLVVTDDQELGFFALLRGVPVRCFGQPFYCGWGLTEDEAQPRGRRRSLEELFAAAYLLSTDYCHPFTSEPCSFEDACGGLMEWRRLDENNREIAVALGMSIWKRGWVREFLRSSRGAPKFARRSRDAIAIARKAGGSVAVWAAREPADLAASAAAAGVPVIRIEDGFLRSVGLGSDFTPAASIVADKSGIYFDPGRPSDLESLLSRTEFDDATLERARRLIARIVEARVTKYNTGRGLPALEVPAGARAIFVPGQVEDDRSVLLAGAGIKGNLELLRRVRAANPEAFIVFKPHPDVDAGHRAGSVDDAQALAFVDRIVRGVASHALMSAVAEVHTLTSLAGFEALLRGLRVVVHGQPFYAGWGLTVDPAPIPRRGRPLTLEQLVAGVLILYPRYLDPTTLVPCGPETIVERLSNPQLWRTGPIVRLRRLQGSVSRLFKERRPVASVMGMP